MLIDVFELAEMKLTLVAQLHELLDETEHCWLDQASLSHQRGLLLRKADALVWQQFLPGGPTGSQVEEEGHDHHGAHGMDHPGHDMSGTGHQMGHDGQGMDHSGHGVSHDTHEMDHSGHDMSGSGHQIEHEAHGKDHSGHSMPQGTDPAGQEVGGIDTDHPSAASAVQEERSSHQHRDSHERAPKQKQQVEKKASTVDGAASGH